MVSISLFGPVSLFGLATSDPRAEVDPMFDLKRRILSCPRSVRQ